MTGLLLLGALFVTVCASALPSDITIDKSATCGKTYEVAQEAEFRLFGTGDAPAADCSFTFTADAVTSSSCTTGLCYMFDLYAFFKDPKVSLSVETGNMLMTYNNNTKLPRGPVCMTEGSMKLMVSEEAGYVFDPKKPEEAYKFRMSVFHHCGEKGQVKNTKFEDAIDYAKGYHPAGKKEERETSQFVTGILLGFGLSCIFLVVLLIAWCYTRNSPNRGPNRSVGMPKVGGFKKKMKPNQPGPREVEMGVGYKAQDPDKKPETDPLLTSGASDPEKPPVDSSAVTVTVEETKPEPDQVGKDLEKVEKAIENVEKDEGGNTNEGTNDDNN